MAMNRHITSHFYSIIKVIFLLLTFSLCVTSAKGKDFASFSNNTLTFDPDSPQVELQDSISFIYPGKSLIKSLVIPGWGQAHNKAPFLKTLSFVAIETASIASAYYFHNLGLSSQHDYENYADNHWTLNYWYIFTQNHNADLGQYGIQLSGGSHSLVIKIDNETLQGEHGSFITSNDIEGHYDWITNGYVTVVRDHHFYENVGKYNQFSGGWTDSEDYELVEKAVSDTSAEILVMTDLKESYLNMRFDSNQYKLVAKYSITVLMFNHIISGLEAILFAQKKSKILNNSKVALLFNPKNRNGIGGISLTMEF